MRKVRVICSDPYATDCSSDDEDSIEIKRPANRKLFVQEISVLIPSIDQLSLDPTDSSSREDKPAKDGPICISKEADTAIAENCMSLAKERHLGIKKTSSGKWEVQIHHPVEGTTMNLGSYDTFEEATNAYEEKNLEFTLLSNLIKQKNPDVQSQSAKRRRQKFELDALNISETTTGKWAAWFRNPSSKGRIWMGIYSTPEEAVISYCKKKVEFDSGCKPENLRKKGKTSSPASQNDTDIASVKRPGINRTKTGRYGVTLYHPTTKSHHWLGYYDTPEEAAEVFDKKKTELEAKVANQESCSPRKKKEKKKKKKKKKKLTDSSTVVIDSQGRLNNPYKGVRLRKSGRWCAEIKDPIKGKNTYIGTYDTPEEAADAHSKRKRELEEMVSLRKKQKCKGSNGENALEADNSTVTALSSQNSEESNKNDQQILGSSFSPEDEFGFSVINSYGELIGEYSRIDDELWLTGPGNHDECVVNGTIGGTQDLALDQKLFSYH
ncbi:hypothetical protein V2J09_008732 [Rumex salicifolius]